MPLDKNKILRYQVLDRCFRDISRLYKATDLLECCNQEMRRYDYRLVSRRTIQNDIQLLAKEPYNVVFDEKLYNSHYYRYSDTNEHLKVLTLISPSRDAIMQTIELLREKCNDEESQNPQWQWMLLTLQSLVDDKPMDLSNPFVSFENNEAFAGNANFPILLSFIITHQPIDIRYKPFKAEKPENVKIHPYFLKQYNSRWFLIARVDDVDEIITFALDRIFDIQVWNHKFVPSDVDFNRYYDDITGVTVLSDEPLSNVVLKVTSNRYPYIQTKPFSVKQKIVKHDEDGYVISFPMRINNEFKASILSFGSDIEVLKPERLRQEISAILRKACGKYNNKEEQKTRV